MSSCGTDAARSLASDLRQKARVVGRLGAHVLGFGDVEKDVHNVGRHVQRQRELAPPVAPTAVLEDLAPQLSLTEDPVVWLAVRDPFRPRVGGGEEPRAPGKRAPLVRGGQVVWSLRAAPRVPGKVLVVLAGAQDVRAAVGEAQTQAAAPRAQHRDEEQGPQRRQHAVLGGRDTGHGDK